MLMFWQWAFVWSRLADYIYQDSCADLQFHREIMLNASPRIGDLALHFCRRGGNSHLDAKLRRVLGQKSDHVARRVFVGGMPFSYDVRLLSHLWSKS